MKQFKLLFTFIAVFIAGTCLAQELPRHVFAAGGGNFESGAAHFSWTIGQSSPVATVGHPAIILCPGFQQFDDQMVSVKEEHMEGTFMVYPNPCADLAYLNIEVQYAVSITYVLYDLSGKMLSKKDLPSQATSYQEVIDLSSLAPGMYNLMLYFNDDSNTATESIKLIKH